MKRQDIISLLALLPILILLGILVHNKDVSNLYPVLMWEQGPDTVERESIWKFYEHKQKAIRFEDIDFSEWISVEISSNQVYVNGLEVIWQRYYNETYYIQLSTFMGGSNHY